MKKKSGAQEDSSNPEGQNLTENTDHQPVGSQEFKIYYLVKFIQEHYDEHIV